MKPRVPPNCLKTPQILYVEAYLKCVYSGELPGRLSGLSPRNESDPWNDDEERLKPVIRLHCLADKLGDLKTANITTDAIIEYCGERRIIPPPLSR
jgi:hypothetical protein